MDSRQQALEYWLRNHCQLDFESLETLAGDASFRRYFRLQSNNQSFIAMDAPPERENNCRPFIAIAESLRQQGLQTPEIIHSDVTQGFLLLTDFGDDLYLRELS